MRALVDPCEPTSPGFSAARSAMPPSPGCCAQSLLETVSARKAYRRERTEEVPGGAASACREGGESWHLFSAQPVKELRAGPSGPASPGPLEDLLDRIVDLGGVEPPQVEKEVVRRLTEQLSREYVVGEVPEVEGHYDVSSARDCRSDDMIVIRVR